VRGKRRSTWRGRKHKIVTIAFQRKESDLRKKGGDSFFIQGKGGSEKGKRGVWALLVFASGEMFRTRENL